MGLRRRRRRIRRAAALALAAAVTAGGVAGIDEVKGGKGKGGRQPVSSAPGTTSDPAAPPAGWSTSTEGATTLVRDETGTVVARFTVGARNVVLDGPERVFREPSTTTKTVTTRAWVRVLPRPFAGTLDWTTVRTLLADTSPDVLGIAFEYGDGAPDSYDGDGRRTAGDAHYGPLQDDGTRQEGADFNDYLQVPWTYPDKVDAPEVDQAGSLDCSGFIRMVYGWRLGVPLSLGVTGSTLPRRAVQMAASGLGPQIVVDTGTQATDTSALLAGDLVFFDADAADGAAVDHAGIYLGTDSVGSPRFVSSRKSADGPTMGDLRGRSTLDGTGYYASAWRSALRP